MFNGKNISGKDNRKKKGRLACRKKWKKKGKKENEDFIHLGKQIKDKTRETFMTDKDRK